MKLPRQRLHRQRAQLDARLAKAPGLAQPKPRSGWIRATRESLGMTVEQLARRMGVAKSTVQSLEESEARGAISLKSLERAAAALGCRLGYALVPDAGRLEETVNARATALARRRVQRVSHSMQLEAQGSSAATNEAQIVALAAEIKARLPSELWDFE